MFRKVFDQFFGENDHFWSKMCIFGNFLPKIVKTDNGEIVSHTVELLVSIIFRGIFSKNGQSFVKKSTNSLSSEKIILICSKIIHFRQKYSKIVNFLDNT